MLRNIDINTKPLVAITALAKSEKSLWKISITSEIEWTNEENTETTMHITIHNDSSNELLSQHKARYVRSNARRKFHEISFEISAAKWMPIGYGSPNLLRIRVEMHSKNEEVQFIEKRIGLRIVRLVQDEIPNSDGRTFYFNVNGVNVFFKGANFIPPVAFEGQVTQALLHTILRSAADAHMNGVRNWGGGMLR